MLNYNLYLFKMGLLLFAILITPSLKSQQLNFVKSVSGTPLSGETAFDFNLDNRSNCGNPNLDSGRLVAMVNDSQRTQSSGSWDTPINVSNLVDCVLNISNVSVSPCVNNGGVAEAMVEVTVDWSEAPPGENIWVTLGGVTDTVDILNGATAPALVQFTISADGSTANPIHATFSGGLCLDADGDTYDAPNQCIVEVCNNSVDDDGDGRVDCADQDCCCAQAPVLTKH